MRIQWPLQENKYSAWPSLHPEKQLHLEGLKLNQEPYGGLKKQFFSDKFRNMFSVGQPSQSVKLMS